ncbi:hypothetical protein L596_010547 [Steinernema carpocapsae]|uniref:Uncharacterized protein n=1 Tax=Steinernema carpocapsae TaxID=34508 RepID=A0A4V6A6Y1_STECR|nr:hypothetical protein L596_010547 [Steinernema carpocapsae]
MKKSNNVSWHQTPQAPYRHFSPLPTAPDKHVDARYNPTILVVPKCATSNGYNFAVFASSKAVKTIMSLPYFFKTQIYSIHEPVNIQLAQNLGRTL